MPMPGSEQSVNAPTILHLHRGCAVPDLDGPVVFCVQGEAMKHLDLFSGIGGFSLAARWVGWETIGFVEIDPFCQKVLGKHWPGVQIESDIREVTAGTFRERPDIITGGFPCQPFSVAGKQRGTADDRHLWPEMVRVIKEYQPRWVLGENVAGIIPMELDSVLLDLEAAGYEAWPLVIPACGVDAKHRRARVWILAHNNAIRRNVWRPKRQGVCRNNQARDEANSSDSSMAYSPSNGRRQVEQSIGTRASGEGSVLTVTHSGVAGRWHGWVPEPNVGRVANGIPRRVDRLRALGNAIVPQVAYEIFNAIVRLATP